MKAILFTEVNSNIDAIIEVGNSPMAKVIIPEIKERAMIQKTYKLIAHNEEFAIYKFKSMEIVY